VLNAEPGPNPTQPSRIRLYARLGQYLILTSTMVLPSSIQDVSPLDPLLVLPIPSFLPPSPLPVIQPIINAIHEQIYPTSEASSSKLPMTVLTSQMRQITRRSQVLLNAAREGTAQMRYRLDVVDSELRGVEYEHDRVRQEIEQCEEYQ
jgi:THO complex subunit 5